MFPKQSLSPVFPVSVRLLAPPKLRTFAELSALYPLLNCAPQLLKSHFWHAALYTLSLLSSVPVTRRTIRRLRRAR